MNRSTGRWFLTASGMVLLCGGVVLASYLSLPLENTHATHFDVLVVLGTPANEDGTVSPEERERTLEAVREFRAGRAEHIILTGGAAHNRFVEAAVMAAYAEKQGVPADAIVIEGEAQNTIQNIFYSRAIMRERGWRSAEIVSSPSHLRRTALIIDRYRGADGFAWRTDAAHWPREYSEGKIVATSLYEAIGTAKLRWFGFRPTRFLPSAE